MKAADKAVSAIGAAGTVLAALVALDWNEAGKLERVRLFHWLPVWRREVWLERRARRQARRAARRAARTPAPPPKGR